MGNERGTTWVGVETQETELGGDDECRREGG